MNLKGYLTIKTTTSISWPNYHSGSNGDYQRVAAVGPIHSLMRSPASPSGLIEFFPAHPHEGGVGVPQSERHARVIATGTSLVTGRPFNLVVAFERSQDDHGNYLGRAIAESSFHHFVDYNWDIDRGCPSFLAEPPGDGIKREPDKLEHIKTYVRNLAVWLAPTDTEATRGTASNSLSSSKGPPQQDRRYELHPQRTQS